MSAATQELDKKLRGYDLIPVNTLAALVRWVRFGQRPGDFLSNVLKNDLAKSFAYADYGNIRALWAIMTWLYNRAPGTCSGSVEQFEKWQGLETMYGRETADDWQRNAIADTIVETVTDICPYCFAVKISGVCRTCSP